MAELIALLFALMGANDELQIVSVQEVLGDIRAPVAASAPHLVGYASILSHWVTPQQVQDLVGQRTQSLKVSLLYLITISSIGA